MRRHFRWKNAPLTGGEMAPGGCMRDVCHRRSWLFVLFFLAAGASAADTPGEWRVREVRIGAPKNHFAEFCVPVAAGGTLEIQLDSPYPVDFNVHFHTGTDTLFPVRERVVGARAFTVPADPAGEYCLMWTNPEERPDGYVVTARYRVR